MRPASSFVKSMTAVELGIVFNFSFLLCSFRVLTAGIFGDSIIVVTLWVLQIMGELQIDFVTGISSCEVVHLYLTSIVLEYIQVQIQTVSSYLH